MEDTGSSQKRLIGHSGPVYGTSFSHDNRFLLSCSEDCTGTDARAHTPSLGHWTLADALTHPRTHGRTDGLHGTAASSPPVVLGDVWEPCRLQGPHVPRVGVRLFALLLLLCHRVARPHGPAVVQRAHHAAADLCGPPLRRGRTSVCASAPIQQHDAVAFDRTQSHASAFVRMQIADPGSVCAWPRADTVLQVSPQRPLPRDGLVGPVWCVLGSQCWAGRRFVCSGPNVAWGWGGGVQCACGTCKRAMPSASLRATRAPCTHWPFRRTARLSRPLVRPTAACAASLPRL